MDCISEKNVVVVVDDDNNKGEVILSFKLCCIYIYIYCNVTLITLYYMLFIYNYSTHNIYIHSFIHKHNLHFHYYDNPNNI